MQLASDLSTNMPNLRKSLTVPKKTGHVTERLSQNIVLQFVVTSYVEEYFSGRVFQCLHFPQIVLYNLL